MSILIIKHKKKKSIDLIRPHQQPTKGMARLSTPLKLNMTCPYYWEKNLKNRVAINYDLQSQEANLTPQKPNMAVIKDDDQQTTYYRNLTGEIECSIQTHNSSYSSEQNTLHHKRDHY